MVEKLEEIKGIRLSKRPCGRQLLILQQSRGYTLGLLVIDLDRLLDFVNQAGFESDFGVAG